MRRRKLRGLKGLYWRMRIAYLAVRWMPQVNLSNLVWYGGKQYMVVNGVRCESWRLSGLDNGDNGWVKRVDCKKVKTIKNYIGSFSSGYNFYMTSWFDIWVSQGIQDWMRGCNIWP